MEMKGNICAQSGITGSGSNYSANSYEDNYTKLGKMRIPMTNSDQESNNSGRRCYRAAAVCLGLLCVLLLAAVTVLWIQFNNMTKERDQLQTSYTSLTEEREKMRDQLQKEQEAHRKLLSALEQGERYFDQSFYFITIEKQSWRESRRYCQDKGADLVIIKSRKEQEFIDKAFGRTNSWIGLTDVDSERSWKWVDGSALSSLEFWWPGEPNDVNNEDCAGTDVKHSGSSWNDFVCDLPMVGICEKALK